MNPIRRALFRNIATQRTCHLIANRTPKPIVTSVEDALKSCEPNFREPLTEKTSERTAVVSCGGATELI